MKIAVYSVALNEASQYVRWRKSCAEADYAILVDTGSTDGTEMFAYGRILIQPFRFDDARNAALALVPPDADICIALDLDETLEPGWRQALETAWRPETNNAWVNFNFNGDWFLQNNRVHSRWGWRWKHPCHEALTRSIGAEINSVQVPGMRIVHRPSPNKGPNNYLELLAWGQFEDPTSTRMLHYYGRELMFNGFHKEAIERFERYLEIGSSFPGERAKTETLLRECRAKIRKHRKAR